MTEKNHSENVMAQQQLAVPEFEVKKESYISDSGSETEDLSTTYDNDDSDFGPIDNVKSESESSSEVYSPGNIKNSTNFHEIEKYIKTEQGDSGDELLENVSDIKKHLKILEQKRIGVIDNELSLKQHSPIDSNQEVSSEEYDDLEDDDVDDDDGDNDDDASDESVKNVKFSVKRRAKQKTIKNVTKKGKSKKNPIQKCQFCDKVCQNVNRLEVHWKKCHKDEKPFSCLRCDMTFHSKKELRRHGWTQHPRPSGWYLCQFCEKSFNKKSNLVTHERTHTGEKPFVCDQCGKGFSLNSSLKRHADVHVTEEERGGFRCEICLKEFATAMRRKRHYITHKTERDHPCEVCGKAFTQTSSLTVHMKTHFAERTFLCPYCPSAFTRSQHLKKHLKRAMNTALKRIRCRLCDSNFPCSGALTVHMNTHEQYVLKKIFACDICDKKFARKVELRRHSVTHIEYDDLPFQCSVCNKRFGRNDTFTNHMRNVHPIEHAIQKTLQDKSSGHESETTVNKTGKNGLSKKLKKRLELPTMVPDRSVIRSVEVHSNSVTEELSDEKINNTGIEEQACGNVYEKKSEINPTKPVFPSRYHQLNSSKEDTVNDAVVVTPGLAQNSNKSLVNSSPNQHLNNEVMWREELYQNFAGLRNDIPYTDGISHSGITHDVPINIVPNISPASSITVPGTVSAPSISNLNTSDPTLQSGNSSISDTIRNEFSLQNDVLTAKYYL